MRQGQAQRNHRGTKRLSSAAHLLLPGEKLLLPALCRGEARGHALVNSAELLADSTELLAHSVDLRARLLLSGENLLLPALRRGEARVHAVVNSVELHRQRRLRLRLRLCCLRLGFVEDAVHCLLAASVDERVPQVDLPEARLVASRAVDGLHEVDVVPVGRAHTPT